jgi:hypothetical protein
MASRSIEDGEGGHHEHGGDALVVGKTDDHGDQQRDDAGHPQQVAPARAMRSDGYGLAKQRCDRHVTNAAERP